MAADKDVIIRESLAIFRDIYAERLPPPTSEDHARKREVFMRTGVVTFLDECAEVLPRISQYDIETLGSDDPTENIIRLQGILRMLEDNGFEGASHFGNPCVFWSGQVAKGYVHDREDLMSDTDLAAFSMLFALTTAISKQQGGWDPFILMLSNLFSKLYAANAHGDAHVFISGEKTSEIPGLEASNNFWHSELSQLQRMVQHGKVDRILVHRFDNRSENWLPPIDINDTAAASPLVIRRREFYSGSETDDYRLKDDESLRSAFKKRGRRTEEEKVSFAKSAARPSISYRQLKSFAQKFREQVSRKKLGKIAPNLPDIPSDSFRDKKLMLEQLKVAAKQVPLRASESFSEESGDEAGLERRPLLPSV